MERAREAALGLGGGEGEGGCDQVLCSSARASSSRTRRSAASSRFTRLASLLIVSFTLIYRPRRMQTRHEIWDAGWVATSCNVEHGLKYNSIVCGISVCRPYCMQSQIVNADGLQSSMSNMAECKLLPFLEGQHRAFSARRILSMGTPLSA